MTQSNKEHMNDGEKKEFRDIVKAFTDEEKVLVVRTVPNEVLVDEVKRRLIKASTMLESIGAIMSGSGVVVPKETEPEFATEKVTVLRNKETESQE